MLITRENVELARTGEWNTSMGKWKCTRSQLADAVRAATSGKFRNPILVARGHKDPEFAGDRKINADGQPALGQVRNLRLGNDGDSIVGDLLIPEWLDGELPATYPSRSIEADVGVETADGEKYGLVISGLALLGVTKPAIQPLAELAASDGEVVEYGAAFSLAASIPAPGHEDAPEVIEAGAWNEALHPRGAGAAGGQFVAKGSGYGKDSGKTKEGAGKDAATVRDLQKELIRLHLLDPSSGKNGGVDGLFGPKTEAAVKKWQTFHGHLATGRVSMALLKTLQGAKKSGSKPMARPSVPPAKTAPKPPVANRLRHGKVRAAAEELLSGLDLEVNQVGDDFVACGDASGRTWVAKWGAAENGDESIEIGELTPATVSYTPLANTISAGAAHNMARSAVLWPRDWEVNESPTSHGDTSVDITQLREALGLDDTADEAAALAKLAELKSQADASASPPADSGTTPEPSPAPTLLTDKSELPSNSPVAPDLDAIVAEKVAAALGPIVEANKTLVAEVGTLSGELADRKKSEAEAVKTRILASAVQAGKITPADKESWAKRYDEAPKVITEILASYAPGTAVPIQASGYAGSEDAATSEADEILKSAGLGYLVGGNN